MKTVARFLVAALVLGAGAAHAAAVAAVDVTEATTSLTNQIPSMTAILVAVLGLTAIVMAFKWIKKTMAG